MNNTPPHALLDLPEDAVEQVAGDRLGSFWQAKTETRPLKPHERGYVPEGIVREAYSWGRMSRLSVGGTGAVGAVISAASQVLWMMLLPFALCNVAYWSRRLHRGEPGRAASVGHEGRCFAPLRQGLAGGAWVFRYAALVLTLITTLSACVIAVDVVALQCQPGPAPSPTCYGVPDWLGFLGGWGRGQRVAAMTVIPVAFVLAMHGLSILTRTRFEQASRNQRTSTSDRQGEVLDSLSAETPVWPLLATKGFWNHGPVTAPSALYHLAGSWFLVVGLSAQLLLDNTPADQSISVAREVMSFLPGVSLVLLVVVVVSGLGNLGPLAVDVKFGSSEQPQPEDARRRHARVATRRARWLVLAAVVLHAVLVACASWPGVLQDRLGAPVDSGASNTVLGWLIVAAVTMVSIAMGVRRASTFEESKWRGTGPLLVVGLGMGLILTLLTTIRLSGRTFEGVTPQGVSWGPWVAGSWVPAVLGGVALALITASFVVSQPVTRPQDAPWPDDNDSVAWSGRAPGVFLALALFFTLTTTSAITLTLGDRLNGDRSAGSLVASLAGKPEVTAPLSVPDLAVPDLFGWFAVVAMAAFVLTLVVVGVLWGTRWSRTVPWVRQWPLATSVSGPSNLPGGQNDPGSGDEPAGAMAISRRMRSMQAHRAEPLIATFLFCVLLSWLFLVLARQMAADSWSGWSGIVSGSAGAIALVAGVALGAAATGARSEGGTRPLAILWDLSCVVPRAAHPLAPPSYGERVVPELLARCRWWLSKEGALPDDRLSASPRAVLLSAHSLGGVLAVACILGAPWPTEEHRRPPDPHASHNEPDAQSRWMVPRLGLLTYGCQLRTYFGRFFPELFGPDVLGVVPSRSSRLDAADPWVHDWLSSRASPRVLPGSVRHLLSAAATSPPRWVNLWRLTDYLGFPLVRRPPVDDEGRIDVERDRDETRDWYAEEVDFTAYLLAILDHGDYQRSAQYAYALTLLSEELVDSKR